MPEKDFALIASTRPFGQKAGHLYPLLAAARNTCSDGLLCVVIRTKQGARSLEKYLAGIYSQVETVAKGGGYRVFAARR